MTSVIVVAIVFGSILTFAALICGTVIAVTKMRQSGLSSSSKRSKSQEADIIQEIYQGLGRMEKRIDTLETILMDAKERKGHRP